MSASEVEITIEAYDVAGFEVARAAVRALGQYTLKGYSIDHGVRLKGPLGDLEMCRAEATYYVSFDTTDVDVRAAYHSMEEMCDDAGNSVGVARVSVPVRVKVSR